MLAKPFERLCGPVAVELKVDGCRCIAVKQNNTVTLFTRNGKVITGFPGIESDILKLPLDNVIFDGEIVGSSYKDTMNKLFAKDKDKEATYIVFDTLSINDFHAGVCKIGYYDRKKDLYTLQAWIEMVNTAFTSIEFVFPMGILAEPTNGKSYSSRL